MRIRTDTTLDQDCVLKATVFVCTSRTVCLKATVQVLYSVHGRVMVNFNKKEKGKRKKEKRLQQRCSPTEEHTTNHVRTLSEHSSVKSRKNARSIAGEKQIETGWGHTAHKHSRKDGDLGRETRWRGMSSRVEARSGPSARSRKSSSSDLPHAGVSAGGCIDTIEKAEVQIR